MGLNLCDRCVADCRHERNPNEIVVRCGAVKAPMTNADCIRAMSDEELAHAILTADFCKCCEHEENGVCHFISAYPNIPLYGGCKEAALKWLQQTSNVGDCKYENVSKSDTSGKEGG